LNLRITGEKINHGTDARALFINLLPQANVESADLSYKKLVLLLSPKTFLRGSSLTSKPSKNRLANAAFSEGSGDTKVPRAPWESV